MGRNWQPRGEAMSRRELGWWLDNIDAITDRERCELVRWIINNDGVQPIQEAREKEVIIAYEHRLYVLERQLAELIAGE